MQDISGSGSDSSDSKYLSVKVGETVKVTLKSLKVVDAEEEGHSPTIQVLHEKKEKSLNVTTVLKTIIEGAANKKQIKVGSQIQIENLGKGKGKNYYTYKVGVIRK